MRDSVFFSRFELARLIAVYARRVRSGDWRDYAIDQGPGRASFSVFRSSFGHAEYRVEKTGSAEFALMRGRETVRRAADLDSILILIDRRLELVSG